MIRGVRCEIGTWECECQCKFLFFFAPSPFRFTYLHWYHQYRLSVGKHCLLPILRPKLSGVSLCFPSLRSLLPKQTRVCAPFEGNLRDLQEAKNSVGHLVTSELLLCGLQSSALLKFSVPGPIRGSKIGLAQKRFGCHSTRFLEVPKIPHFQNLLPA